MKNPNGKIGIAILTHNRPEVYEDTLAHIKATLPRGAKLVVVDDASEEPQKGATFRFEKNVGIATAKNKCLELLDDCEHIFLFDDDCYPRVNGWERPYIESPEPHLMYLFLNLKKARLRDAKEIYRDARHFSITNPRGCMLYFHRPVLDIAGGMDTRYEKWGNEHGDLSNRIYNLGLTSFRFMDVTGSDKLIFSGDEDMTVRTTVKGTVRREYLAKTKDRYEASFTSTEYIPYKKGAKQILPATGQEKAVVCAFLTGEPDAQRQRTWKPDYRLIDALRLSVASFGVNFAICHNCFSKRDGGGKLAHFRVEQGTHPYAQRWLASWQYLRAHPEIGWVFNVDATDVEMLHNPFPHLESGVLYVGDEKDKVGCQWMRLSARDNTLREWVALNHKLPLLNCGVVGGDRETMMRFLRLMYESMIVHHPLEVVDMPVFNRIVHTWNGKVESGRKVTTVFKQRETNSDAWFKHK